MKLAISAGQTYRDVELGIRILKTLQQRFLARTLYGVFTGNKYTIEYIKNSDLIALFVPYVNKISLDFILFLRLANRKANNKEKIDNLITAYKKFLCSNKNIMNSYEALLKNKTLDHYFDEAEKNNFKYWLISKHDDCAKDHLAYQGKIYSNKEYKQLLGAPVFMITRPNCRHFAKAINENEAREEPEVLLKKYKMTFKEGKRGIFQTKYDYEINENREYFSSVLSMLYQLPKNNLYVKELISKYETLFYLTNEN